MFTFVRLLGKMFSIFYNLVCAGLSLYISLCMNAFTIPIFVLLYLPCKVFRIKTPKIKFKGFMLYPSWNYDTVGKSKVRTGIDYEEYCGAYLLKHGFHDVIITPPTGDYGADIVAKDERGNLWVFQCKQYSSKLGNSCVQEVVAAKKHYGATKAGVMTNSKLTEKARELAFENEVLLFECMD